MDKGLLARIAAYIVFVFIVLSLYCFFLYTHPRRIVSPVTPKDFGLEYEPVTIRTADGIDLDAWYIPNSGSRKSILVCHGYPADKGDILSGISFLAADYTLLLFDFRAMGKSQGSVSTAGSREQRDFQAAAAFLKKKGFKDFGVFGFSMGAAVALKASGPEVRCIVADSSFADLNTVLVMIFKEFGFLRYPLILLVRLWTRLFLGIDIARDSPERSIARLTIPVLLIHSEKDSLIPVEQAYRLKRAYPPSSLWVVPGADHGRQRAEQEGEYRQRIKGFFQEHL